MSRGPLGLERAAIPIWLYDYDHHRVVWANEAALEMWRSPSLEELRQRDYSDLSESVRARLARTVDAVRAGSTTRQQITMYPRGVPVTAAVHVSGAELDDGRPGLLFQCVAMDTMPDPELLRGIEAIRHTPMIVVVLDRGGEVLMQNPSALRALGDAPFAAWFADAATAQEVLRVAEGEALRSQALVRTRAGERWYAIDATLVRDPVTGAMAVLVHLLDESARRGAEQRAEAQSHTIDELHRSLETVERQRRQIMSLSAPILTIGRGALAVPIIGALDEQRSADLSDRLLHEVVARGAREVILDLTGTEALDGVSAGYLTRLASALRLLGARTVITGIQAAQAQAVASSGADFSSVVLLGSLSQGIEACLGARARAF